MNTLQACPLALLLLAPLGHARAVSPSPLAQHSGMSTRLQLTAGSNPVGANATEGLLSALPISFVENRGQWDPEVLFLARRGPITVRLEKNGLLIQTSAGVHEDRHVGNVTRISFEGANTDVQLTGLAPQTTRRSYFSGTEGHGDVGAFDQVLYHDLYPGVDLRLREASGRIEYDLLLEPGADLDQVVFECSGVEGLAPEADGTLTLRTPFGPLRQSVPTTWSVLPDGGTAPLECHFRILDEKRYGFVLPERDPDLPVVIDPGFEWSTLYGGSDGEVFWSSAWTPEGNIVCAGATLSPDLPTQAGAFDANYEAQVDGLVACLSADGTSLLWATYLNGGGTFDEHVLDVAVGANGEIYVVGVTQSPTIPVTADAYQQSFGGGAWDGFVTQLSPDGTSVVYSSFLGGSLGDWPSRVEVTDSGDLFVAGTVLSQDFPVTAGAFQPQRAGGRDYFLTRMDLGAAPGNQIVYSTYIGGSQEESYAASFLSDLINFDFQPGPDDTVTVCGLTRSTDFPVTANALQGALAGGAGSFVVRLDLTVAGPAALLYGTHLGGTSIGGAPTDLEVDTAGVITMGGFTYSDDFPTTAGAFTETFFGPTDFNDGYIVRIDPSLAPGNQLLYSTFLTGEGYDPVKDVAVLADGSILAAGLTGNDQSLAVNSFPTTCGAIQPDFGGTQDAFVSLIYPGGEGIDDLLYSTFIGGSDFESAQRLLHVEGAGIPTVVINGNTTSANYPTTQGVFQETLLGISDSILTRLELNPHTYCVAAPNSNSSTGARICGTGSISLADNDFTLSIEGASTSQPGLFFYGPNAVQFPFGDGVRCVGGQTVRLNPPLTTSVVGQASLQLDLTSPALGSITVGEPWGFQFWYRDPAAGGAGFNLSNGLRLQLQP